ncbi:MAG: sensor histidine kinase N-terminal domain-containing protein [Proteobacteria bacterium]|nr:sensor histidine kinase N-terminal domain-containing protein [Pseudomonadota bacterium]
MRQKLLWWVLGPMVILLILNVALIYRFGHETADRRHDRFLMDASKILLDQLRTSKGEVVFNIHAGALNLLSADKKDQLYYSLSGWQQDFHFGAPDLPAPPGRPSETPVYYSANYAGHPVRMMQAVIPETDVASGRVVVRVGKTLVLHDERAQEWMWRILPSLVLSLLFAGGMVWWGVGRGLRPLLQLRDEVIRRSSLDLSPLPEDKVVAEIRPLIHGFNDLMARLDTSFVLKRRFIADASHQLRTPLTGLKAQAELALRLDDPVEIRHSLLQMRNAADHAAHLANQLLLLARAEPGAARPDGQDKLDLAALARNATEYWVPKSLFKNIDLGFENSDGNCRITGNGLLLSEMLNNLIDNALRYTGAGGHVTVRIICEGEAVRLEVEDNGPGIPVSERERVFERFYSVLGTRQEGCGLGLAIVREIAELHHARVDLLSGAGGAGTLVSVTFRTARQRWKN